MKVSKINSLSAIDRVILLLVLVNIIVFSRSYMPKQLTAKQVLDETPIFASELLKEDFIAINQQDPSNIEIPLFMYTTKLSTKEEVTYGK